MLRIYFVLSAFVLLQFPPFLAVADPAKSPEQTLFIVRKQSGLVAAEQSYKIQCQVDADKTNKIWQKGRDPQIHETNDATVYTTDLKDFKIVRQYIERAAQASLDERSGPTDKATGRYYGVLEGMAVDQYVKLLLNQSTVINKNTAKETDALLRMAEANCSI